MTIEELKCFITKNKDNYAIQLKRHHRKLFDEINTSFAFNTFGEKLYHHIFGNILGNCEICGKLCKFDGIHKGYRKRCSYACMGKSKFVKSHETRNCVICGTLFEIYKNRKKATCSSKCLSKLNFSDETNEKRKTTLKKSMLKEYGVDHPSKIYGFGKRVKQTKLKNHGNENYVNIEKQKTTKETLYGNGFYTNPEKIKQTCLERYGVPNVFHLKQHKTNGKQISKFQRREYEKLLKDYPDARLEEYLPDVQKSVDIYIPSKRKIVECFGDFWHCNPSMYSSDYYNKYVHMNASEIWQRDQERIDLFKSKGYTVEVVWENSKKHPKL